MVLPWICFSRPVFAIRITSKSPDMAIVDLRAGMGVSWQRQSTSVMKLTVSITVSIDIRNCFWRLRRSFTTNSIEVIKMASHESDLSCVKALYYY